jgi:hypothetical protein
MAKTKRPAEPGEEPVGQAVLLGGFMIILHFCKNKAEMIHLFPAACILFSAFAETKHAVGGGAARL